MRGSYGHKTTTMPKLSNPPAFPPCFPCEEGRDVLEEKMTKVHECGMEESGRLESSEKTTAILGDGWWPHSAKQDGDRITQQFLCNLWKKAR